ncbi:hypothetical protein [Parvibaculum sp.]|uniref:hypothetical protein n=1 Tax=Parvibaculum sp. TaxID=2024848 RepID=UPI000C627186|nr:hypothetical protein [Parvibaculum sp.]MAM95675.1 hypothetical protein [Parvibaculum sp.]|tara:strand:- start:5045 stop:7222 length:2178 start_codon:yes stop_codon:yes gene_type:complete
MAKHDVTIRLSTENREQLIRDLRSVGGEGEKMARQIERSGQPASRGLLAVNAASREAQGSMQGAASRAGIFGSALSALGPAGLAAGAGLGAIALGAARAFQIAREGMDFADEIDTATKRLGIGVEVLQEYRAALQVAGDAGANFDDGARTLLERMGETARGTGEGVKIFERLGIQIRKSSGEMKSLEDILPEIADGMASVGSEAERADIANKLFGGQGQNFVALLNQGSDALARQREEMREMGIVMDEQVVKRYAEASDKSEILTKAIDVQLKSAFVDLAPTIVSTLDLFAKIAKAINAITDSVTDLENKTTDNLAAELDRMVQRKGVLLRDLDVGTPRQQAARRRELEELDADIPTAQALLKDRERRENLGKPLGEGNPPLSDEAISNAQKDADVLARLARQIETFGDARQQAIDNALGRLSKDASPAARAEVERLAGTIFDATANQKELNEAVQEEIRLRNEGKAVTAAVATDEEKLAARKAELKNLLGGAAISLETYNRALAQAGEQYDPVMRATKELSGEIAGLVTQNLAAARSFDDLADIADQALTRILAKMLEVTVYEPIEGAASSAITSLVSGLFHGGGMAGEGGMSRHVPAAAFAFAPRFHTGKSPFFGAGEMPAIIQKGEGIFTPRQMNNADQLFRAMAGMATSSSSPRINLNLYMLPGERAETRERRNADGSVDFDVIMRQVDQHLAGQIAEGRSETGRSLESKYGLDSSRGLQR